MKSIFFQVCLSLTCLSFFTCCKKEKDKVDKKTSLIAKIDNDNFEVKNAVSVLSVSTFYPGKKQLVVTGENNAHKITLILKNYKSEESTLLISDLEVIGIYTPKNSNVPDTAISGKIVVSQIIDLNYAFPDLPYGGQSGQYYQAQIIVGTFDMITKHNVHVSNGVFGLTFNK